MDRKPHVDTAGAVMLTGFATLFAFNQVVIKVSGGGFGPIFQAGLRSAGAVLLLLLWMRLRRIPFATPQAARAGGLLAGILFAVEFMAVYVALDLTSVARASIMLYSMPVWLALAGHFLLPGEALTGRRLLGFCLAMIGVVLALADPGGATGSLTGDLLALFGAMCWAGIALTVRLTPISEVRPIIQVLWQLAISAPLMLLVAWATGDLLRDPSALHLWGLAFQTVVIASFGFLFWFWLLQRYPASGVASFSFLSPVLAVFFGWLILGEAVSPGTWGALGLVAVGLVLINRK